MRIDVKATSDWKKLGRDLRKHYDGKKLRKDFIRETRAEVKPVADQVKKAYRAMPSNTPKRSKSRASQGSLRRALANATRIQIRLSGKDAGVRLRVDGRKMPDGMGNLPKRNEGVGRWRHPVFGDEEAWASQSPRPVFYPRVRTAQRRVRRRLERLASDLARKVSR